MVQAVADKPSELPRSERDRLRVRLRRLQALQNADGHDLDATARRALGEVHARGPGPGYARVRRGLVRIEPVDGNHSDRRLPPMSQRPPLARLISPRGAALRTELILLFVAQCRDNSEGARPKIQLPIEATRSEEIGLLDLVASVAEHDPDTEIAVNRKDNRLRQIKTALDKLSKPGNGLVSLPRPGASRGKYENFRLQDENGDRAVGSAVDYAVPSESEPHVKIPKEFFLNGWVHALTDSEIATWLMFRDLSDMNFPDAERIGVHLSGELRVGSYGLSRDAWDSHKMLSVFGLLRVEAAEGRRADGTVVDFRAGDAPIRHRFWVTDEALSQPALPAVFAGVAAVLDG